MRLRSIAAFLLFGSLARGQQAPEWAIDFPAQPGDYRYSIARDSSGAIFVVGATEAAPGNWDLLVAKFDSSGQLVTSFGAGGQLTLDTGGVAPADDDLCDDLKIDALGRLYVLIIRKDASGSGPGVAMITRLLPDGSLDPAFGTGGSVVYDATGVVAGANTSFAESICLDTASPPNVYLSGSFGAGVGMAFDVGGCIARYTGAGVLDPAWGNSLVPGMSVYNPSTLTENFFNLTFAGGGIYAVGISTGQGMGPFPVDSADAIVARFDGNGDLVGAFGAGGVATYDGPAGLGDKMGAIAVANGRVYVGGVRNDGVPGTPAGNALILALDATTGALVPGFNGTGVRVFDSGLGTEWLHAIEVDVDGKIYAAGVTPNPANPADEDLLVLRINPDGTLDGTFGTGGVYIADSGNAIDGGIGIALGSAYVLTGWGNNNVRVLKFSTGGKKVVQEAGGDHLFCGLLGPEALILIAFLLLRRSPGGSP